MNHSDWRHTYTSSFFTPLIKRIISSFLTLFYLAEVKKLVNFAALYNVNHDT